MKYQDNQIDLLFKEQLGGLEKMPPPMVWDKVQGAIPPPPNRKKAFVWLFSSAAAMALLAIGIGIGVIISDNGQIGNPAGRQMLSFSAGGNICPSVIDLGTTDESMLEKANDIVVSPNPHTQVIQQGIVSNSKNQAVVALPKGNLSKNYMPVGMEINPMSHRLLSQGISPGKREFNPSIDIIDAEIEDDSDWISFDGTEKIKFKTNWSLGGSFSPALAMSPGGLRMDVGDPASVTGLDNSSVSPGVSQAGYATGVGFGVGISDRMSVQSGVLYSQRNGRPDNSNTLNNTFFDRTESFTTTSTAANSPEFTASFIEIPLALKYDILKGKILSLYVNPGISGNFLINYVAQQEFTGENVVKYSVEDNAFQPAQLNAIVGAGVGFKIWKGMQLNLEPNYRIPIASNSYAFLGNANGILGVNTGLQYSF